MYRIFRLLTHCAVAGAACLLLQAGVNAQGQSSSSVTATQDELPVSGLTLASGSSKIHILPTAKDAAGLATPASDPGPLFYHGGPVMNPSVTTYAIFWVPSKLQSGGSTGMSAHYQSVQLNMLNDYAAHGIDNINTQYYQKSGSTITYIQNKGGLGSKYFVDSGPYPASGCHDSVTPGNCITDAQVQAEIKKVLSFAGLKGGLNTMFLLFTSSGEGSCFTSSSSSCAYTQYCAYHSYFNNGGTPVVYSNEPYGVTSFCQIGGVPSPNGDPNADTASTAASHELSEAITDPELNAWFTNQGNENGDLCAYNYGHLGWDGGRANQMWNGHFYLLQQEYNNHTGGCSLVGP